MYFMAIWWMVFMVSLIDNLGVCSVLTSSRLLVCIGPFIPTVLAMRDLTFQHLALISSIRGLYLSSFVCMVGE